jgi:hypothetical protein
MTQPTYEMIEHELFGASLRRYNPDGSISSIPINEGNSDYQRYLRWLENPDAEENGTIS